MSSSLKMLPCFWFIMSFGSCYLFPHFNGPYHPALYHPSYFNWLPIHRPLVYDQRVRSELIQRLLDFKKSEISLALNDEMDVIQGNGTTNSTGFRSGLWPFSNRPIPSSHQSITNNGNELPGKNNKQLNDLARLIYIGAGNIVPGSSANYLFKTSYAFVAATATLCVVSTCIPADQFVSGYSSVTCRRKRSLKNFDPMKEDILNIEPSAIQQIQTTALPSEPRDTITLYPETITPQNSQSVLSPSFTITEENDEGSARQKRFLFVLTSTITTYSFVTTTYTYKLYLYTNSYYYFFGTSGFLTCRPSNVGLC